jgi:hypothetical protein
MASTTLEDLLDEFGAIAPAGGSGGGDAGAAGEFQALAAAPESQNGAGAQESGGETSGMSARAVSGSGGGTSTGSIATTLLESGLGLVPLVGELVGLFGGSDQPQPLEKYAMPTPIGFEGVDTGNGMSAADYDQMGMPRLDAGGAGGSDDAGSDTAVEAPAAGGGAGAASTGASGGAITVNVQAMDARSFLDRSSDIAQAVRAAMLNMSSINDVVNDL